jgi:hypothetical protein
MGIFLFYKEKWWRKEMGYKEDFPLRPTLFYPLKCVEGKGLGNWNETKGM